MFLRDFCPHVVRHEDMSTFAFEKIAVDASLYVWKYKMIFTDKIVDAFVELVVQLREEKIHPIFIFDGHSPPEKVAEQQKRKDARLRQENNIKLLEGDMKNYSETNISPLLLSTYKRIRSDYAIGDVDFDYDEMANYIHKLKSRVVRVKKEDYDLLKETLDAFNIPWLTASGEAEITCAQLCNQGLVKAVLSSDTDVLAAGCQIMIKDISKKKQFVCLYLNDVLRELNLTTEEFTDLCIMCGTDFNNNVPKIGPKNAYKYISKYKKLEYVPLDTSVLNFKRVRELFSCDELTCKVPFVTPINYVELEKWLSRHNTRFQVDDIKRRVK